MRISDWSSDVCSSDLTKTDTPLLEVPQSISIITARDLQDRGLHAVDEAMWYVAGAQGGVYGMDTRSEWLLVRGFQPARYLDGLALPTGTWRSEEHTSELQSLMRISYAVLCLKKKNTTITSSSTHTRKRV